MSANPRRLASRARRADTTRVLAICCLSAFVGVACIGGASSGSRTAEAARKDLKALIEDVRGATAVRYDLTDDRGESMDTVKVIASPGNSGFAAVYHTWRHAPGVFDVNLATSTDLVTWTWRARLGTEASQPTIKAASDGGYVVAWEVTPLDQDADSYPVFRYYRSWDDLLAARPTKTYAVELSLSPCCEGTVNLYTASSTSVDAGFHYLADMVVDRQARATMDWSSWTAAKQPRLDATVTALGVRGNVGDRDTITFEGFEFTLLEGQLRMDDIGSERLFIVDQANDVAEQLDLRTEDGSAAVSNMTAELVELDGRRALVVAAYIFSDGPQGGPLLYYRLFEGG